MASVRRDRIRWNNIRKTDKESIIIYVMYIVFVLLAISMLCIYEYSTKKLEAEKNEYCAELINEEKVE